MHFQRHINFLIKLQCLFLELLSSEKTLFLEAGQLNFSSPPKMKAGQYNIHLSNRIKILQSPDLDFLFDSSTFLARADIRKKFSVVFLEDLKTKIIHLRFFDLYNSPIKS